MTELIQVTYASRSTFPTTRTGGIEPELARILLASRRNNPRRGLVGALYYGDGFFFQCIEGSSRAVDELLAKLENDPRHRDLKILSRRTLTERSFSAWSMKYVALESDVKRLLRAHRLDRFDPYRFDPAIVESMIQLLHGATDAAAAPMPLDYETRLHNVTVLAWAAVGVATVSLILNVLMLSLR